MKIILTIISLLSCLSFAQAQNTNITVNSDLKLSCKFEKVILKNSDHNFESFTNDQIKREDINKLIIESKTPDVLNVKNLSEFFNQIDLEVKISNKDIFLIQAFDKERNYSESAVYTRKTGELIHEITKNINHEEKEKDISFYSCKNNNKDT
ncbi:hypothetical protein OAY90_02760 [Candidatus Pelagibacter sp.]|nr:hypothetical protein [Candidatus Pelagibacter sp.]